MTEWRALVKGAQKSRKRPLHKELSAKTVPFS